jgi:hypothetical protein
MKASEYLFLSIMFFVLYANLLTAIKIGQTQKVSDSLSSLFKKPKKDRIALLAPETRPVIDASPLPEPELVASPLSEPDLLESSLAEPELVASSLQKSKMNNLKHCRKF